MSDSKRIATEFFNKLCNGDFPGGFASMSDDATWSLIGTTRYSRTFNKEGMLNELVPMLSTFVEAPQMHVKEVIAEGDRAVVIADVVGVGPTGPYKQDPYCFVLRIRDGKVAEIVEFLDTVAVEQAICGNKVVPQ
ncbi:MAG: nuclear transport factor 2 family protein [Porticoccaceae bacterium]